MTNFFKRFAQDESGAVTVDWVVLTAAIVGLGIAVLTTVFRQGQQTGREDQHGHSAKTSRSVPASPSLAPAPAPAPAPG